MLSSRNKNAKRIKALGVAAGLSLMAILLVGATPSLAATSASSYDNVQVFVHTTNSTFSGTYTVTAYNSTGYPVITYSTPYPAASFELPSASYIFTVSADSNSQSFCGIPEPVAASTGSGGTASPGSSTTYTATASSAGSAIVLPPCYPGYSDSEYGFAVQQVSGPTSLTISTRPVADIATTTLTLRVTYANGTAAAGAYLYASVLGGDYYSLNSVNPLNMSGQVGTSGTTRRVVPAVPVEITAWNWVPVNLPTSPGSTVVIVGGQKVNVTVTWQPAYVGFAGSLLMVPPQTTGSIVLQLQQQNYWATPQGVSSTGSLTPGVESATSGSVSSSPNLVPASLTSQQSTGQSSTQTIVQTSTVLEQASTQQASSPPATSSATNYNTVLFTVGGALALGIASASLIIVRRRPDA